MAIPYILTLPRLHELAAPIYLVLLLIEWQLVSRGAARGNFRREDTHTSLIMGIGSIVWPLVFGTLGAGLLFGAYENIVSRLRGLVRYQSIIVNARLSSDRR